MYGQTKPVVPRIPNQGGAMITERQLHLFKSRRQRGTKPPTEPEFKTQCMVADTLKRWATPTWLWTHIPLGEERPDAAGARLKRMGTQAGWPDFIFVPPKGSENPRPHFLELKRRGGKLTEHQAAFALWCKLNDCPHAVAHSYDEAVAILKGWGALWTGVKVQ
jgi:hypothetical protein